MIDLFMPMAFAAAFGAMLMPVLKATRVLRICWMTTLLVSAGCVAAAWILLVIAARASASV